jgi:predicted Zn-dependent peptidase
MTTADLPRLLAALTLAAVAPRALPTSLQEGVRKTTPQHLALQAERLQLPNGLAVLLAPDPTVSSVLVYMTFRAGAVYEPPGKSGLAHLAEHLLASGPTPATNYAGLLERRRARHFNASTDFDTLTFESVVPAEELPLALWVAADRLATLPPLLDDGMVERERRVVVQERAALHVDAPYGLFEEQLLQRLYSRPHPLHGGVVGLPAELASVTAADVRAFAASRLVPANAVLTIAGRFDPEVARRLVEDGLGRLPGGARATPPAIAPLELGYVDTREEPLSRRPRVTMAWRFPAMPQEDAAALGLGAQLLTFMTDGAFDMRISAGLEQYAGESMFMLEVTLPYDEPLRAAQDDAEGFLRQLTLADVPVELLRTANLLLDRSALFELDSLQGRAAILTHLELRYAGRPGVADLLGHHWQLDRGAVRDTARIYLRGPRVILHARPTRPRPPRLVSE